MSLVLFFLVSSLTFCYSITPASILQSFNSNGFYYPFKFPTNESSNIKSLLKLLDLNEMSTFGIANSIVLDWHYNYFLTNKTRKNNQIIPYVKRFNLLSKMKFLQNNFGKLHKISKLILKMTNNNKLYHLLSDILNTSNIVLISTDFFCKNITKVNRKVIPFHQDQGWFQVEPINKFITVWISLNDIRGLYNIGCINFIKNSHKKYNYIIPNEDLEPANNGAFTHNFPIDSSDLSNKVSICDLTIGDSILFDGLTLHGSGENLLNKLRCGLIFRYTIEHFTIVKGSHKKYLDLYDENNKQIRQEIIPLKINGNGNIPEISNLWMNKMLNSKNDKNKREL